jgi:membrane protease YdiL (CAAX protease family)
VTLPIPPTQAPLLPEPPATERREVALLAGSVVALFLTVTIARLAAGAGMHPLRVTDARLWSTIALEALVLLVWLPRLLRRGWTLQHATRAFENWDVLRGVGLALGGWLAYAAVYGITVVLSSTFVTWMQGYQVTGRLSWWTVVGVALLNPVFEEFLYLGYVANVLRRHGSIALVASVAVRVALHLYQGPMAFVSILPVGIVFSSYYLGTGRLWPVIAAHTLLDAIAFAAVAFGGS